MMYSFLEWMNINYQLNSKCILLLHWSNKISKYASTEAHGEPKGKVWTPYCRYVVLHT